jgi:hypothetical protein
VCCLRRDTLLRSRRGSLVNAAGEGYKKLTVASQISPTASKQRENKCGVPIAAILAFLAVIAPVIAAYSVLYQQGLAAPFQDDYHALFAFGAGYVRQPGWAAKAAYVIAFQHNEYKLIFLHVIAACEISLTGHLDFVFLNTLGDLFLLPLGCLLWLIYRKKEENLTDALIHFVPVSLLLFSLTYWETVNWAMASVSNIPVILFSLLAIYWLVIAPSMRRPWIWIAFACIAGVAAGFSLVNGLLLAPVGLLILVPRRAFKAAAAWCAAFVAAGALYSYHYERVVHRVASLAFIKRPVGVLTFVGSALPSLLFAMLLGLVLLVIGGSAIQERFDRKNPAAFYSFVWILLTAILVGWVRGGSLGTLASRYSMYSLLTAIFCLEFLVDGLPARYKHFNPKLFYAAVTICALVFCIWTDARAYRLLRERKEMVLAGLEHYRSNPAINSPLIDPFIIRALKGEAASEQVDLTHALESGVYTLPLQQK